MATDDEWLLQHPRITIDPWFAFGRPIIRVSKTPLLEILKALMKGHSVASIVSARPGLSAEDVHATLIFASSHIERAKLTRTKHHGLEWLDSHPQIISDLASGSTRMRDTSQTVAEVVTSLASRNATTPNPELTSGYAQAALEFANSHLLVESKSLWELVQQYWPEESSKEIALLPQEKKLAAALFSCALAKIIALVEGGAISIYVDDTAEARAKYGMIVSHSGISAYERAFFPFENYGLIKDYGLIEGIERSTWYYRVVVMPDDVSGFVDRHPQSNRLMLSHAIYALLGMTKQLGVFAMPRAIETGFVENGYVKVVNGRKRWTDKMLPHICMIGFECCDDAEKFFALARVDGD